MVAETIPTHGVSTVTGVALPQHRRVFWGAVFAGMVIAVVLQLVLSLLGTGIGLSTVDPLRYRTPDASTFGLGAGIWWVVSSIISLFAGGWVAGHLSGSTEGTDSALHGLLTWGIATIVTVYLLAAVVGSVVRGGATVASKTADVAASGVSAVAGPATDMVKDQMATNGITLDSVKGQVQKLLAQTGTPALQPGSVANQASSAAQQITSPAPRSGTQNASPAEDLQATLQRIISSGKSTVEQADRDALVNVIAARTGVSRPEAEQRADAWIKQYQDTRAQLEQKKVEAEAKARHVADDAASASSKAALGMVLALVLGAIAAAVGGRTARRRADVVTEVHRTSHVPEFSPAR